MREHIRAFVAAASDELALGGPVYEFGSFLVEGQESLADMRPLFPGRRFIGCDMRRGPGVDRVEDLANLDVADGVARTVLCLETLEHTFHVQRAMEELIRVLAPGGTLLLSVPFEFHIHDHPGDYWRITPSCLARLLAPLDAALVGYQGPAATPHTVFAAGFKAPLDLALSERCHKLVRQLTDWLDERRAADPWRARAKRRLFGWLRSKGERRRWREYYDTSFSLRLPVKDSPAHQPDPLFVEDGPSAPFTSRKAK